MARCFGNLLHLFALMTTKEEVRSGAFYQSPFVWLSTDRFPSLFSLFDREVTGEVARSLGELGTNQVW